VSATVATQFVNGYQIFYDTDGTPLAGGFATFYLAGTSTPVVTYTDYTLGAQNTETITLDANGGAFIFLDPSNATNTCVALKLLLQRADGTALPNYPVDGLPIFVAAAGGYASSLVSGAGPTTTLTIAGGAITPTRNIHALNPEGGSPDDLDTIETDGLPDGSQLIISNNNGSAAITVRDGVGNVFLSAGSYVMSTTAQRLVLVRDGASWYGVDRQSGVGDVVGPSSSTDNAITRFDGTTGKLLQNSTATLSDAGLITVPAGTGSGTSTVGGVSAYTVTSTPNSGTAETILWEPTIPANTLATDGDAIVVDAWGTGDTGSDTKTLRAYWNSVLITSMAADTTADAWRVQMVIRRSGATSQVVAVQLNDSVNQKVEVAVGAATLSSSTTFKITGQGGASNEVVLKQGSWAWTPHP
jgi:hypothetical protein